MCHKKDEAVTMTEQFTIDQATQLTMSTLQGDQVGHSKNKASYVQWRLRGAGPDGLSYLAVRENDGEVVEIKVLQPIVKDEDLAAQLRRRASLADLCATALVRRIVDIRLDNSLPLIVIERPCIESAGDRWLHDAIDLALPFDRLVAARELVAAVRLAHRVGLEHGHLEFNNIVLGHDSHLRLDFTSVNVNASPGTSDSQWSFRGVVARGILGDLVDLQRLLRGLLDLNQLDLSSLSARSCAGLRNMLRATQVMNLPSRHFPSGKVSWEPDAWHRCRMIRMQQCRHQFLSRGIKVLLVMMHPFRSIRRCIIWTMRGSIERANSRGMARPRVTYCLGRMFHWRSDQH